MSRSFVSLLFILLGAAGSSLAQITLNPAPTRALGQDSTTIKNLNPNLVEGREFDTPEGLALDTSTNPPALYVCDTVNNRVLGFKNAGSFPNGQTADLVLGQPDLTTTLPPAQTGITGTVLVAPTGIVVDTQGNVYVVDSGNNRILRFPKPFAQTGAPTANLVIGQASFTTNGANQGGISAATLSLTATTGTLISYPAFDASGNLWVGDAGNNRILRFNATALAAMPPVMGPAADVVLGQPDFVTGTYTPSTITSPLLSLTAINTPTGVAFDTSGNLFVDESVSTQQGRILMWTSPFYTGEPASRILGIDTSNPPPPAVSEFQLNVGPGNLFAFGNGIAVTDTFNNRILVFPPVAQWTPGTTYQAATAVAGQPDFSTRSLNAGNSTAGPNGFALPAAGAFAGGMLYVADTFNNRVIVIPQNGAAFGRATMVLGQDQLNLNAVNLTEGREFDFGSNSTGYDAGIAVDLSSATPHLYVADTFNNRILGYNDLRSVQTGAKADLVIGQPDFQQTLTNYPSNTATPNASGLFAPTGVVVDSQGNLWVADTGNSRVLRFPAPFANYTPGTPEQANLVLGQASFSGATITDPTDRTMAAPYGLAFTLAGGLLVSDTALNRVLYFAGQPADFTSGMSATKVFGQPDFNSSGAGNGLNQMNAPRGIADDTDDRLYVADTANGRIDLYNNVPTASLGQPAALTLTSNLRTPTWVYVSAVTGEIWVADPGTAAAVRFPAFLNLNPGNNAPDGGFTDPGGPLALTEDAWGNLLVADQAQRVALYYAEMSPENAANYLNPNALAPGMIAAMFTLGTSTQFGTAGASATSLPLPTTLNGVQVLFNGAPVPLFYVGPSQINFQVPIGAPQTGTADIQAIQPATGRILGDTTVAMTAALPGFFTAGATGSGNALALNQDNTVNTADNPAAQGTVIQLFGTGQGFVTGAPPDGSAPTGPAPTSALPLIVMGAGFVTPANIQYSGLAPGEVGVWQVNVLIPNSVISLPNFPTQVIAIVNGVPSGGAGLMRGVYIHVKQ